MRISELADATHETTRTIRFYEASGLLPAPTRTPGGYRDYDPCAIEQIHFIRALQSAGLTLADIATLVHIRDSDQPTSPSDAALLEAATAKLDATLDTLTNMRRHLTALATRTVDITPTRRHTTEDR